MEFVKQPIKIYIEVDVKSWLDINLPTIKSKRNRVTHICSEEWTKKSTCQSKLDSGNLLTLSASFTSYMSAKIFILKVIFSQQILFESTENKQFPPKTT